MALTAAESRKRYVDGVEELAKLRFLNQWYFTLAETLKRQEDEGAEAPDFSRCWVLKDASWLRQYQNVTGDYSKAYFNFIDEWIGDQLREYGLMPRDIEVHGYMDSAVRTYFLEPGQMPLIRTWTD